MTGEPDEQVRAESHEGTNDGADAPLLVIEYTTTTGPIITLTGTTLSAFSTTSGLPSDAQTYTVSGSNLEGISTSPHPMDSSFRPTAVPISLT